MKKYEYMIVYACHVVKGRCFITTDKLINSYEGVEEIDKIVREKIGRDNAIVVDFKLLREIDNQTKS